MDKLSIKVNSWLGELKKRLRKDNPRWVVLMIDVAIVYTCYLLSNVLINSFRGIFSVDLMLQKSILIVSVYTLTFWCLQSYKGIIRQTGISDAVHIFKVVGLACLLLAIPTIVIRNFVAKGTVWGDYLRLSYSVIFMHGFLTMVAMVAARVCYRNIYEKLFLPHRKVKYALIFGASRPALVAYSLLRDDKRSKVKVLAFVEDKSSRIGRLMAGIKVLDIRQVDETYISDHNIEEVIIAVEDNNPERMASVLDHFHALHVELKIMPPGRKLWQEGKKREIRALKIDDLLGRPPIKLENPVVEKELKGRVILITGAAGSIGSELARQIALQDYAMLILLDQAESALYDLQHTIRLKNPEKTRFVVGNVRDKRYMRKIFDTYHPEYIFHAAAYKHVPLMESNPYDALWTNLYGSRIVADLAVEYKAYKFVMVSTDKAVNPTNIMGTTKRAAEIYVSSCNNIGDTNFIITRFGNVLGSNGSVIPLFEKQLEKGGPLTLTHPDITRYFMTIPEASLLVQEAAVMGGGGEIFVFDMGKSVKIIDLAKRMIKLKGLRYPQDVDIKIVGLRPGEKIFEELLANDENTKKTHHPKILIAEVNQSDMESRRNLIIGLCKLLESDHCMESEQMQLVGLLKEIVPEFKSQNSIYEALDKSEVISSGLEG
ncbi:FlaA1/EpsC-like NDP-sugar epimerase [Sphingobacterium yanglingense]|uniref:FlaA1/EpsC-like NDP-sugar epimerase n=1 Tax=Sphingobacterium yanglingense TaxID=1437280 RepID=A0A4R6WEG3_9SPHI|nr:FlaA1/EpsC-like NDP-sugar epimerase [Sphingobacterium yanglingense]